MEALLTAYNEKKKLVPWNDEEIEEEKKRRESLQHEIENENIPVEAVNSPPRKGLE
jgi:hypothetical protein